MDTIRITSRQNEVIKRALSLSSPKGRKEYNLFFTEGMILYKEAQDAGFDPCEVFLSDSFPENCREHLCFKQTVRVYSVPDSVYEKISAQSAPEGIFCVFEKFKIECTKDSCILLLEGIRDPGNLGTILRSAAAFGAREIVAVDSCDIFSPKTVRATMGALFRVPFRAFDSLSDAFAYLNGYSLYAASLDDDAIDIADVDTSHACIMIGNEGHGLSREALDKSLSRVIIPIEQVESLNASVAASIILYDAFRKRKK